MLMQFFIMEKFDKMDKNIRGAAQAVIKNALMGDLR